MVEEESRDKINNPPLIFGTTEDSLIWFNTRDTTGLVFFLIVWIIFLYIIIVLAFLVNYSFINRTNGLIALLIICLSFWSHVKTVFSDPGGVPKNAQPLSPSENTSLTYIHQVRCGKCDCYKPPKAHHGNTIDNYKSKIYLLRSYF